MSSSTVHAAKAGQSTNERDFILQALGTLSVSSFSSSADTPSSEQQSFRALRQDGRNPSDMRGIRITFGRRHARAFAEVQLGRTRVRAVVTSEIVTPYPDRPVEGFLTFNMDAAQLLENSGGATGGGRFGGGETGSGTGGGGTLTSDDAAAVRATYLTNIIESAIREARAIDTEALCIIAGEKVWSIHCEIHVLDDGGNLTDAASLASIAALRHFRRPEVTVNNGKVIEHPLEERVPTPLSVHHTPLSLTFAFIGDGASNGSSAGEAGGVLIVDPTHREEYVASGSMTVIMNLHGELCGVHKTGAPGITTGRLMRTIRQAKVKIMALSELLKEQLRVADEKAKAALIVHANKQRAPVGAVLMANTVPHAVDRSKSSANGALGSGANDSVGEGVSAPLESSDEQDTSPHKRRRLSTRGQEDGNRSNEGESAPSTKAKRMFNKGIIAETSPSEVGWNKSGAGELGESRMNRAPLTVTVEDEDQDLSANQNHGAGQNSAESLAKESAEFSSLVSELRQSRSIKNHGGTHLADAVTSAAKAMSNIVTGDSEAGLSIALTGKAKKNNDKKKKKRKKKKN